MTARVDLPVFSIAALAVVLVAIGWADHWGGSTFGGSLTLLRLVLIGPLTLVILGVFMVTERIWPAQRRPLFARGHRHDLILTVMNAHARRASVTVLTLAFVEVVRRGLPWIVLPRIGTLPRWGAILAIVVAMDFCNWAVHLANHRVRMLWRFHELHHSQEDMNVLTVFRTHPFIHVSYLLALIPSVVLLSNGALSVTVLVLYGGMVAFADSNTGLGFGPLERIFVSPNFHRIHHKLDGPQDVNLGFALTIWTSSSTGRSSHRGHDQDRHRAAGSTADRRTGRVPNRTTSRSSWRRWSHPSARCASSPSSLSGKPRRPPLPQDPQPGSRSHGVNAGRGLALLSTLRKKKANPMVTASIGTQRRSVWTPIVGTVVNTRGSAQAPGRLRAPGRSHRPSGSSSTTEGGKLFAWFNGPGIHGTALSTSRRPPTSTREVSSRSSAG